MKRYSIVLVMAIAVLVSASSSFAGQMLQRQLMNNYSAVNSTPVYGSAYKVPASVGPVSTVIVNGIYKGGTLGNFSGTFLLQCGPTSTGPWTTCKDVASTAVSSTTNTTFNISSMVPYIRVSWAKTKHRIIVWFYSMSE